MSANTRIFEAVFRFRSFFYEIAHEVGSILPQPLFLFISHPLYKPSLFIKTPLYKPPRYKPPLYKTSSLQASSLHASFLQTTLLKAALFFTSLLSVKQGELSNYFFA